MATRDEVEMVARGLDYPVTKEEIMEHVRHQAVDGRTMVFFESIPDLRYEDETEIAEMLPEETIDQG